MLAIRLRTRLEELPTMERSIAQFGLQNGIGQQDILALNLVLEELLANLIAHAFDDNDEHDMLVRLQKSGSEVRIRVEDDGRPFDPGTIATPDLSLPLDKRAEGGLGLHMVRQHVDEIEYTRTNGKNVTTLLKRCRPTDDVADQA